MMIILNDNKVEHLINKVWKRQEPENIMVPVRKDTPGLLDDPDCKIYMVHVTVSKEDTRGIYEFVVAYSEDGALLSMIEIYDFSFHIEVIGYIEMGGLTK